MKRFQKIALLAAVALLAAYAAVQMAALRDSHQAQPHAKEAPVVDAEQEKLDRRQREARATLVKDECGDDDRCSAVYREAIKAWDACRERGASLPPSCATDYEAAVAKAKALAGPRAGSHEH